MSQYSLSVLCHFVALADCIRSGYVGGQFVITRNILSFSFLHLSIEFKCQKGSSQITNAFVFMPAVNRTS